LEWQSSRLRRFAALFLAMASCTERNFRLHLSVGIAKFDWQQPISLDELMQQADRAMYENKRWRKQNQPFSSVPEPLNMENLIYPGQGSQFGATTSQTGKLSKGMKSKGIQVWLQHNGSKFIQEAGRSNYVGRN
jgi:hypothetical protein